MSSASTTTGAYRPQIGFDVMANRPSIHRVSQIVSVVMMAASAVLALPSAAFGRLFTLFAMQPYAGEIVSCSPTQQGKRAWRPLVILAVIVLVAVGCSDDDVPVEASTETTAAPDTTTTAAPDTTTTAAPIEVPLATDVTETYSIPGFGYSIDYPSGWFAETRGPQTQIAPTEEALEAAFSDVVGPIEGLGVTLDHRTVAFLQGIGLTSDDPTAQDLVEFNTAELDWTDVRDVTEVEIFGSPAIRVRVTPSEGGEIIEYQGVRSDTGEVFILGFGAPTDEILDEFLPTWDAMFESITATEDPPTVGGDDLSGFEPFADGTYTMSQLGVPVTFTVTGEWSTQPVGAGFFVITTPDSSGPGDHDIVAIAPTQLFDAAAGEPLLAGDDIAGWLESVPATATISESTVGEIGGFATTVFTVDAGEESVDFADVGGTFGKSFDSGFIYEVHFVEHPDGPISFIIGTPRDDLAWLDTARAVVKTIELG